LIISLIITVFTGCDLLLFELMSFRVYYHKGSANKGSVPIDDTKYEYGDTIIVENQGTLEKEGHMFLGWMEYDLIYSPGTQFESYGGGDIHFTAKWNDNLNDTFEFTIEGDEVKVTKFKYENMYHSGVVIPSIYSGKPVTEIGDEVFRNNEVYMTVRINSLPKNLKRIGSYAFTRNNIKSSSIPSTVESIGSYAFANCSSITSLTIHDSLKTISSYAFANCKIYSLNIPDSLESIGISAFENNNINEITFGTGRTSIPQGVFKRNNLKYISLPDNITLVEDEAFSGNNIGQIIIGANVEIKGDTSFGTNGASFKKFYDDNGKQAGEYGYTANFWVKL